MATPFTVNNITYEIIGPGIVNLVSSNPALLTTIPPIDTVTNGPTYSIVGIGNSAFSGGSSLTGPLVIGNSVTTIGNQAFFNCSSLNGTLTIGAGVTTIGNAAFYNCSSLNGTLAIGAGVTGIGNSAFYNCSSLNGTLTIGTGVTTIGNSVFHNCSSLTGPLVIGNAVTTIGNNAFRGCGGLNGTLTIGAGVTGIGEFAFYDCHSLTGPLVIGNAVTSIGEQAFRDCSSLNGTLTIGTGVTGIGNGVFFNCSSLAGPLTIGNAVTTIGESAFYNCSSLNGTLTIGTGVTGIGNVAFQTCSNVSYYRFLGNAPSTGNNIFEGAGPTTTITYTIGTSGWPTSAPYLWPLSPPYTGTQLVATGVEPSVCVLKDTPICVGVKMYKKIQDLREGDSIIGAGSNTPKKIKQVVITSHKYTDIDPNNVPYKIPADFYAKNIPVQDIYISGTHAIVFSNSKKETILISVIYADTFVPATVDELAAFGYPEITYYNIELDEPDGMYAGGVPVETLGLRKSLNL